MTAVSYDINISYKSCDGQFQISSCKLHGPNFIAVRLGGNAMNGETGRERRSGIVKGHRVHVHRK